MLEQMIEDIKAAMKAKDNSRLDALRMLKSAFIENNTSAKPKSDAEVAIAHVKKPNSMEAYPAGSQEVVRIQSEIEYLAAYVPQPLIPSPGKPTITSTSQHFQPPLSRPRRFWMNRIIKVVTE
jgi:uncharacterized protein YqeY